MSSLTAAQVIESIQADLTLIQTGYQSYDTARLAQASTLEQMNTTQTSLSDLDLQLRELNRQEETLNKQFLDARKNVAPTGVFARLGLSTMQDWTLASFFFTFALFGLILTGFLASASIFWGRVAIFGTVLTAILLAGSALLIRILG